MIGCWITRKKTQLLILMMQLPLFISGCSGLFWATPELTDVPENTIGSLLKEEAANPSPQSPLFEASKLTEDAQNQNSQASPNPNIEQLIAHYREALDTLHFPHLKASLLYRLSFLEASYAEQLLAEAEADEVVYLDQAIARMQAWLALEPDHPNRANILYQLSKLLDLKGERDSAIQILSDISSKHPNFVYLDEVRFRLAEEAYSLGNYEQARSIYQSVAETQGSQFGILASYMQGWSHFKIAQLESAFTAFDQTLARIDAQATQVIEQSNKEDADPSPTSVSPVSALPTTASPTASPKKTAPSAHQASIKTDALRATSLILGYLGNADFLVQYYGDDLPEHAVIIYQSLAEHLLSKKRYLDTHRVYSQFQARYPMHPGAARMGIHSISMLKQSHFFQEAFKAQASFYAQYAPSSPYYASVEAARPVIDSALPAYLMELSERAHERAQKGSIQQPSNTQTGNNAQKDSKKQTQRKESTKKQIEQDYLEAIYWYEAFLQHYAKHPEASQQRYLLAEALYSVGHFEASLIAYETVAYEVSTEENPINTLPLTQQAESGYKALTGYQKLFEYYQFNSANPSVQVNSSLQQQWFERRLESQIKFVEKFPGNSYAADIRFQAAEDAFQLKRYPQSAQLIAPLILFDSEQLTAPFLTTANLIQPPIEKSPQALSLLADAFYNLNQFTEAAATYKMALLTHKTDPLAKRWTDYYANSLHQLAKQAEADEDVMLASSRFIQLADEIPTHPLASAALYDAGLIFASANQLDQALNTWRRLRTSYPKDPLNKNLFLKFADAYQQQEEWGKAADELNKASQRSDLSLEIQQTAALESARLYEKSGNEPAAINAYRDYANKYPKPIKNRIQAEYQLVQLYAKQKDTASANYWLEQLKESDKAYQGKEIDSQAYLLSSHATVAGLALDAFNNKQLSIPLKQSFKAKQTAMTTAIDLYQALLAYEVAPFYQESIYQLGDIFLHLSNALLNAPKPSGLSELELEEYEILLEEQAYPFEEKAIEFHESNIQQMRAGTYNDWVKESINSLKTLVPSQYHREEQVLDWSEHIH